MIKTITYIINISLILLTPFVYSDELYNGAISAKQIWFYGVMELLMLVTIIDHLFDRQSYALQFNKIDLALLVFYAYYLVRAATAPYMPILHNEWLFCVILYFIINIKYKNTLLKE